MNKYTHLSKEERESIYKYLEDDYSQEEIADKLHRDPSTISRELSRNRSIISREFNRLKDEEKQRRKKYYI